MVIVGKDYMQVVRESAARLENGRKLDNGHLYELGCSNDGPHLGNHSLYPSPPADSPSMTAFTPSPFHEVSTLRFAFTVCSHFPQAEALTRN